MPSIDIACRLALLVAITIAPWAPLRAEEPPAAELLGRKLVFFSDF